MHTDIGMTGGGNNTHQIYVRGVADHRLKDGDIVEHIAELVRKNAPPKSKRRKNK